MNILSKPMRGYPHYKPENSVGNKIDISGVIEGCIDFRKDLCQMSQKWLSIIVLFMMLVGGVSAQEGDRMANPIRRDFHPIGSVELVKEGDDWFLVVRGDLPDGCDFPSVLHTERVGKAFFVDLYRELPFDVMCPMVLISYEQKIPANDLITTEGDQPEAVVVVINNTIFGVERFEDAPPTLSPFWVRGILPYDTITLEHTETGNMKITLAGTLTDGCAVPVYRAVPDWQNVGFTTIEAYTAIPLNAACLLISDPYEATMTTALFDTLAVNGVSVPYNPAISTNIQKFQEQAMSITSVSAEWVEGFAPNIKITVQGIVDGCDDPIQIVPQPSGDNTYVVKVVRVMPINSACTMIARDFVQELMFAPVLRGDAPLTFIIGDQIIVP